MCALWQLHIQSLNLFDRNKEEHNLNLVVMMGRIVNDLELKTTPQGLPVCTFRLAVDRNYQKKGEEKKTDFFNVVCWRATAEFVAKYFSKGRLILVEGEMQTRQYDDKNGNKSTWYEVVAERVSFTGEKKEDGATKASPAPPPSYGAEPSIPSEFIVDADDDYPF